MVERKRQSYMSLNTKAAYYVYSPLIILCLVLFYGGSIAMLIDGEIVNFCVWMTVCIIVTAIQIPLIGRFPEYYIFEEETITVRSLMRVYKVVKVDNIRNIYWQKILEDSIIGIQRNYYIVDDNSSNTINKSRSKGQDLLKIPIDKKSKAIITSIWPHEIQESHFPVRK